MASSSSQPAGAVVIGKDVTVRRSHPMLRPGVGSVGTPIMLRSNFFKISAPKLTYIYQYCLFVDAMRIPEGESRSISRARGTVDKQLMDISATGRIEFIRNVLSAWWSTRIPNILFAHDGRKTVYTAVEIPSKWLTKEEAPGDVRFELEVDSEGRVSNNPVGKTEKVYVRLMKTLVIDCRKYFTTTKRMDVYESSAVSNAIDMVLATGPVRTHVPIGRSFFSSSNTSDFGTGAEAWKGFYQTARRTQKGILLNMDISFTPFWSKGGKRVYELLDSMRLNVGINNERTNKQAGKILSGLKVRATHNNITYRIFGFTSKSPFEESFFDTEVDARVTVAQYFKRKYSINLQDQRSVCAITNRKKKTLVPLEMLIVHEKQRLSRKMTPQETAKMIRVAATRPKNRIDGCIQAIQNVNHSNDPTCKAFQVQVDKKPVIVRARQLPPPTIMYKGAERDRPSNGAWNPRHNKQLLNAIPIRHWVVLNLTNAGENQIQRFGATLVNEARRMGIDMHRQFQVYHNRNPEQAMELLFQRYKRPGHEILVQNCPLQLILVVVREQDTARYNTLKIAGDIKLGVATQVMLQKHLDQKQNIYHGNLLLKINSKLGGGNFHPAAPPITRDVPFAQHRHIVLGADVTHPAGAGDRPSVAALVGSKDHNCTQFTGAIRNQNPRQEIFSYMQEMFTEVYFRWWAELPGVKGNRNAPPPSQASVNHHATAIIMFRDGVSEGQFEEVMDVELTAIRRACAAIHPQWNPKITFIVVTKRHHARFFPTDPRQADRSGNCPPGTVVDTDVVSTEYYDFYLNSHAGIQGTSRPSKYTVLVDESKIPVDNLQAYVFRMAHNYSRCSRSVSIVSAAYYAHLLAFRGRAYLNEDESDTASSGTMESIVQPALRLHDKLSRRMFYV